MERLVSEIFGNNVKMLKRTPVSGGDINRAYVLELSDGSKVFAKANLAGNGDFFRAEEEGLDAIRKTETVRVPKVLGRGANSDDSFLVMEYIERGYGDRNSSEELGHGLAMMHMADASELIKGGAFGFAGDNYIGATLQINTPKDRWVVFFAECRLAPQFERASSYFSSSERKDIESFLGRLDRFLTEPNKPSLVHGDLWAGNYMIDAEGHPWLIDPATYVGHPEVDIAMTELFGGFDSTFYGAYAETAGIDPSYKDRKDLYNLYHLLNHLNLFGSGYLGSVKSILKRYI